jgi:hypothetical protein
MQDSLTSAEKLSEASPPIVANCLPLTGLALEVMLYRFPMMRA